MVDAVIAKYERFMLDLFSGAKVDDKSFDLLFDGLFSKEFRIDNESASIDFNKFKGNTRNFFDVGCTFSDVTTNPVDEQHFQASFLVCFHSTAGEASSVYRLDQTSTVSGGQIIKIKPHDAAIYRLILQEATVTYTAIHFGQYLLGFNQSSTWEAVESLFDGIYDPDLQMQLNDRCLSFDEWKGILNRKYTTAQLECSDYQFTVQKASNSFIYRLVTRQGNGEPVVLQSQAFVGDSNRIVKLMPLQAEDYVDFIDLSVSKKQVGDAAGVPPPGILAASTHSTASA